MSDKPTGVFVRLPLSEAAQELLVDAAAFGKPDDSHDKALLAIGTPVAGGDIPVIGTIHIGDNGKPFFTAPELYSVGGDVVRQSDAQAQIAALEAEVVRLREAIHKIIDMSRNAQTWSLNNRAASCREELSAIGRLGEKTLKGGAA